MNLICQRAAISLGGRLFNKNFHATTLRYLSSYSTSETGSKEHIDGLVKKDDIVVFMKGVPEEPMCGFSNVVIQILRMHGVEKFGSYNVLDDDSVRKGIKDYSNWPTIPQVFFKGEFIGGSDILLEMHQNGNLVDELKKLGIRSALLDEEEKE